MQSAEFKIDYRELKDAIDKLPEQLQAEADRIVAAAARRTANRVRSAYRQARSTTDTYTVRGAKLPRKHLSDSVTMRKRSKALGLVSAQVIVDAPHAHLYEYGTGTSNANPGPKASGQERITRSGAERGSSPAHPTLIPIAIEERNAMYADVIAIVEKAGFTVRRG